MLKVLILKIFRGSMPPDPLNGLGLTVELNCGLESQEKVREFHIVWKVATLDPTYVIGICHAGRSVLSRISPN